MPDKKKTALFGKNFILTPVAMMLIATVNVFVWSVAVIISLRVNWITATGFDILLAIFSVISLIVVDSIGLILAGMASLRKEPHQRLRNILVLACIISFAFYYFEFL